MVSCRKIFGASRAGLVVTGILVLLSAVVPQQAEAQPNQPKGAASTDDAFPPIVPFMASTTENSFLQVTCRPSDEPLKADCDFAQVLIQHPEKKSDEPLTKDRWSKLRKVLCSQKSLDFERARAATPASPAVHAARLKRYEHLVAWCDCRSLECANEKLADEPPCYLSVTTFRWTLTKRGPKRWVFSGPGTGICNSDFLVTLEEGDSGWTYTQHRTGDRTGFCSPNDSTLSFSSVGQPGNLLDLSLVCPSGTMAFGP
jgi:hypothetical protein